LRLPSFPAVVGTVILPASVLTTMVTEPSQAGMLDKKIPGTTWGATPHGLSAVGSETLPRVAAVMGVKP
jgi:hypothetical protein